MFVETIQPRFSETNAVGHIGFTVLPVWFEKALDGVYRLFMPHLEPQEWTLIVVRFDMACLAEINHVDLVSIETTVRTIGNSSFSLVQHLRQDGKLAATAETTLVHLDYATRKTRRIHDSARALLEEHLETDELGLLTKLFPLSTKGTASSPGEESLATTRHGDAAKPNRPISSPGHGVHRAFFPLLQFADAVRDGWKSEKRKGGRSCNSDTELNKKW